MRMIERSFLVLSSMLRHTPTGDLVSAKTLPASNVSTAAPSMKDLNAFMIDFPPCGCARRLIRRGDARPADSSRAVLSPCHSLLHLRLIRLFPGNVDGLLHHGM